MVDEKELTCNVLNIERYGTSDGPGIRTVVFFKGCNLRCKWCANPESQLFSSQIILKTEVCKNCGKCKYICPNNAIDFKEGYGFITNNDKCDICGLCVENCFYSAREIMGITYTQEALLEEILKDEKYFKSTGGGVTFSGGEPLFYSAVIRNIAIELKKKGYSTLIETCGHVPLINIQEVMDVVDYFYFDFKQIDPEKHRLLTGQTNELILNNLKWLCENYRGKISVRYPFIPNYNSSNEEIVGFLKYIKKLPNIEEVVFLPFHRLGLPKYTGLGRKYEMGNMVSLKTSEIQYLVELASKFGINARIQ